MGGLTSGEGRLTPVESIIVSLAGPLSVLLLIGLPALWLQSQGTITTSVGRDDPQPGDLDQRAAGRCSTCSRCCPLDGGNVTLSMLDLVTKGRGRRPAEVVSVVVGVGVGLLALAIGFVFGAVLAALVRGHATSPRCRRSSRTSWATSCSSASGR